MKLSQLICGSAGGPPCTAGIALDQLATSIDRFGERALVYLNADFSEEAKSFGAFSARVLLENACAAFVGRLDPFRLGYLSEVQSQATYDPSKPVKSGFRWQGDVIAPDAPPQKMWGFEHDFNKVSRALLSDYTSHIFWAPALTDLLDALASAKEQVPDEMVKVQPTEFAAYARARCVSVYSTLSKGVHWEYFVSAVTLDEGTLKDTIRDCLIWVTGLALVSHFVPTAYRSLSSSEAIAAYKTFRGKFK